MFGNITKTVLNLVILNIAAMMLTSFFFSDEFTYKQLYLHSFLSPYFRPTQFITYMFLHGNFSHILFNMFGLVIFGPMLEQVWGEKKFIIFYFICGIGAALLHSLISYLSGDMTPMLGASGAVMGVIIAFATLFPNTEMYMMFIPVPIKAKYMALIYIGFDVFGAIQNNPSDNVAHFAHLGGALVGFILVKIWHKNRDSFY